jgi:hypothetical protein
VPRISPSPLPGLSRVPASVVPRPTIQVITQSVSGSHGCQWHQLSVAETLGEAAKSWRVRLTRCWPASENHPGRPAHECPGRWHARHSLRIRRSTGRQPRHDVAGGTARKYSSRPDTRPPQMTVTDPMTCADDPTRATGNGNHASPATLNMPQRPSRTGLALARIDKRGRSHGHMVDHF